MRPNDKIGLDSAMLRSRVRGYTPRPVPVTVSRLHSPPTKAIVISDVSKAPIKKVFNSPKTKVISDIQQPVVKHMTPESRLKAEQLILEMEIAEAKALQEAQKELDDQLAYNEEQTFTLPIPKNTNQIVKTSKEIAKKVNKSYAISAVVVIFIVVGSVLGINGFKANQQVEAQVKAISDYRGPENTPSNMGGYDETKISNENKQNYTVADYMPRLFKIPSIKINARVKRISVNVNNEMGVPDSIYDAGWYDGSAKPGDDGTVFIRGRVSGPTQHGVFFYLSRVEIGDEVSIEMGNGKTYKYKIVAAELIDAEKFDLKKALKTYIPGKKGLNIMTDGGKYMPEKQDYNKRLLVYAVM